MCYVGQDLYTLCGHKSVTHFDKHPNFFFASTTTRYYILVRLYNIKTELSEMITDAENSVHVTVLRC